MPSKQVPTRIVVPAAVVLTIAPAAVLFGYRYVTSTRIVRAAASAPHAAFTLSQTDLLRRGADRGVPGRESLRVTIAQRSDGSRVEESTYYPGTSSEFSGRTIQMSDGTNIRTWDSVGLKTTHIASANSTQALAIVRAHRPTPVSECETDALGRKLAVPYTKVGVQTVPGLNLQVVKFTRSNPDTEAWHAPQLDCQEVYHFVVFKNPDGTSDSSERVITKYAVGEPNPKLFDISALAEASPVTAFVTQYRRIGWPEDQIQKHVEQMKSSEAIYQSSHR